MSIQTSNIITAAPLDDKAPTIDHYPQTSMTSGINALISASVYDNISVASVILHYRVNSDGEYTELAMKKTSERSYSAQIPAKAMVKGTLEYYISADDPSNNVAECGSAAEPVSVPIEDKTFITSVSNAEGSVGEAMQPVINGINFTTDAELYIDNEKVDYTFVSDKELDVTGYVPKAMGKKTVMILIEGEVIASIANAVTVTDDSIFVENENALLLKQSSNPQYIYYRTNFAGRLTSYEVSLRKPMSDYEKYDGMEFSYNYGSMFDSTYDDETETYTYKMKCNANISGNDLFYLYLYNIKSDIVPEIVSVKINGVEVENVSTDKDRLTFVDEQLYVPVESISILNDSSVQYNIGDVIKIDYIVEPANATMRKSINIRYNSELVRKNDDGTFTAIASGYAYFDLISPDVSNSLSLYIKPEDVETPSIVLTNEKSDYASDCDTAITANITDNNEVKSAALFYRVNSDGAYTELAMRKTASGEYKATIPAADMKEGTLEYYISASDGKNTGYRGTADSPFTASVVKMVAITSVSNAEGSVGEVMQPVVKGLNFTPNTELYIDGDKVEFTFVSENELDIINYVPTYMGKKSVMVMNKGQVIASLNDAISVADSSVFVRNKTANLVTGSNETQYIFFQSNYSGWINTFEVTFKEPAYLNGEYVSYCFSTDNGYCENGYGDSETGLYNYTFRCRNNYAAGNNLFYFYFGDLQNKITLDITSVKINGIEVSDAKYDESKITYLSADKIVPVEAVIIDDSYWHEIKVGDVIKAEYSFYPANATVRSEVTYSYDSNYLKYNGDGTFTAIRSGYTNISVYSDGIWSQHSMQVYIKPEPVKKIVTKHSS